jgi:hypothetical protein
MEESLLRLGTEENGMKKISYTKYPALANRIDNLLLSETYFGTEFQDPSIFFPWKEFRAFFSSGTVSNGIP